MTWTAALFIEAVQTSLAIDSPPPIAGRYSWCNRSRIDIAAVWVVVAFSFASGFLLLGATAVLAETFDNRYAAT